MWQTATRIIISAVLIAMIGATTYAAPNGNPNPKGNPDPRGQLIDLQVLGINDYHGHLEANTPGNIGGDPAGGSEYLSAKLNELRQGRRIQPDRRRRRPHRWLAGILRTLPR